MGILKTRKRVDAASAEIIRWVFGSPQGFYSPEEAAELLGWNQCHATQMSEQEGIEVTHDGSGARIAWREIVAMLTAQYSQAEIEDALGPAMASVIPESVRLTDLRIRIPRYRVVMLARLAGRERISVDELMSRHLLDLASAEGDWLRRRIPGFEAAMWWPEE